MNRPEFTRGWALNRLVNGAYERMTTAKKIHFWLESWCSYHYGRQIMAWQNNRRRSPSGLEWAVYEVPWYGVFIARAEFQFRYLIWRKPDAVRGFFPFFKRSKDLIDSIEEVLS